MIHAVRSHSAILNLFILQLEKKELARNSNNAMAVIWGRKFVARESEAIKAHAHAQENAIAKRCPLIFASTIMDSCPAWLFRL